MARIASTSGAGMMVLVLVLLGLGLTASMVTVSMRLAWDEQATVETTERLRLLAEAVSSTQYGNAERLPRHYEQDVGALPSSFNDLLTKPGPVAACTLSTSTRRLSGWCGPYWNLQKFTTESPFNDGWGSALILDTSNRHVRSPGSNGVDNGGAGDDLLQKF